MKWQHYLENKPSLFSFLRFIRGLKAHGFRGVENKLKYNFFAQKIFFKRKISWDFPLSLNIESTNDCNFSCLMCPRRKTNRGFGKISLELYKKIIDQIAQRKKKLFTLTLIKDGEPLLHSQLPEMIAYAKEKNVAQRIEIFTNGSLLSEKSGRALIKSGLDVLYISLNATSSKTHQKITGTTSYNKVVENLRKFMALKKEMKSEKPLVVAKTIAMEETRDEIPDFKKMWQNIADQVIASPGHNYGGGIIRPKSFEKKRYPCILPWYFMVVNFDGEATTCCANYLRNELIMGDLKKEKIRNIWQSEKYKKLRRDHLSGDLRDWPACSSCDYWQTFVNLREWLNKQKKMI